MELCRECTCELTTADYDAERCTQCGTKIPLPLKKVLEDSLVVRKTKPWWR